MPVEQSSQADIGYQDELWLGRTPEGGGEIDWTQVLGIESLNTPERTPEEVDVTHMQSPGRTRETIPGLLSSADWSQDMQYWPAHASQTLIEELAELTEAGTKEDIHVEFVVGGVRRTYRGYVNAWTPQSSIGEKRTATLAMKIFERISPDPRVVT